jgi:PPP family 3-phenylpropionic acid transporter
VTESAANASAPPAAVAAPPHSTRPQYFLSFAVLGSLVPFISVLLAEWGLSRSQIGTAWAVQSLSVVVTPLLVTLLADLAVPAWALLVGLFAVAGAALAGLMGASAFWPILVCYALHNVALQPVFPLQDGVHFAAQSVRRSMGLAEIPYATVRVFGTIGYIVPSVGLYFWLRGGGSMNKILPCGIVFCAVAAAYALLLLPRTPAPPREQSRGRLPTVAAARALREPHVAVFCVAMFLLYVANQAYYPFFPLHLTERCGVPNRDIGLITHVGTVGEIFYMFGFVWITRHFTVRRVMVVGSLAIAARFFLLATFPQTSVAIATQLIHGLTVLVLGVVPPIFLNQRAADDCRNSIQGLYTMLVIGGGKVIGSQLFGKVAEHGLATAFYGAGGVSLAAVGMLYFTFREGRGGRGKDIKT